MREDPDPCGCAAIPKRLFAIGEIAGAPPVPVWMMRCPSCGVLHPHPAPGAGSGYEDYYTLARPRGGWRRWVRALANLTRGAYLDRATPAAARRILDFGCGSGDYLARVSVGGRTCFGTDLVEPRTRSDTWSWLGIDHLADGAPFDWITLGHVLEHLSDPAAALARLAAILAPEGAVWIATPNADSFLFAAAGRWARDVDYPRHHTILSALALRRLLSEAGLSASFVSPPRLNAVLNTLATARNILADHTSPRRARLAGLARTLAALAAHLLKPRPRRDHESPELIAVCKKLNHKGHEESHQG